MLMADTILFAMHSDRYSAEPQNIELLSALAKDKGRPFQTALTVLDRDDLEEVMKRVNPAIVAFSAITGSHQMLIDANRRIKKMSPSTRTVIGGPYATFRPQLIHEEPFDALGIGECDEAWPQLLDEWAAGRSGDDVHNIVTQGNASRVVVKKKSLLAPGWVIDPDHLRSRLIALDDLPYLDRDLVYSTTRFRHHRRRIMMAGRGCPFRCTYCFEHAWNEMYKGKGNVLQRYSVKRLCAELVALKQRWPTPFIKFYDDVFPCFGKRDREWLEEFAEVYPREVGVPFHALVRADLVNEESEQVLRLLKKAGIASLTMSIEGGNAFSRDYVLIRDMTDEDLRNSFAICRRHKINTYANTILAVPVPTLPDVYATEQMYQAQLNRVLFVADKVDPKRSKQQKKVAAIVDEARASAPKGLAQRRAVDEALRALGVRATNIAYDKESVWYNVKLKVSFGEFPIMYPYQGTQLGRYCEETGAFDGDYDKLNESYQTASPLDCFSPREKLQQQNLAVLGTTLLLFSGSYNPVMNALAKPLTWLTVEVLAELPLTKLYTRIYSVAKTWMHTTRIYPSNSPWSAVWNELKAQMSIDQIKQFGRKKKVVVRVGQTLGGSAAP